MYGTSEYASIEYCGVIGAAAIVVVDYSPYSIGTDIYTKTEPSVFSPRDIYTKRASPFSSRDLYQKKPKHP